VLFMHNLLNGSQVQQRTISEPTLNGTSGSCQSCPAVRVAVPGDCDSDCQLVHPGGLNHDAAPVIIPGPLVTRLHKGTHLDSDPTSRALLSGQRHLPVGLELCHASYGPLDD
jgi:hypothetical protein